MTPLFLSNIVVMETLLINYIVLPRISFLFFYIYFPPYFLPGII